MDMHLIVEPMTMVNVIQLNLLRDGGPPNSSPNKENHHDDL